MHADKVGRSRSMSLSLAVAVVGSLTVSPLQAQQPSPTLVFQAATVVDVTSGQLLPNQTVVIAGSRIQAVGQTGKVSIPKNAQVIEASGKYLVPGFWDMHSHVDANIGWYPRFIAHGVTGLRDMAQRFPNGADSFRVWQREVATGTRVGPRAIGPSADLSYRVRIRTPEDAARLVDSLKAAGMAFLKMHDGMMDPELYFALMREARRAGIPVDGHYPVRAGGSATDSGQRSVEHAGPSFCWPHWPRPWGDSAAIEEPCALMAKSYVRNNTWLTLGLVAHWSGALVRGRPDWPMLEQFKEPLAFVRMMRRMGVKTFLTGTDLNPGFIARHKGFQPGTTVLDEMVFFTWAGLTPLEALQAATLNPAKFFNATDSLGTVAQGKLADLVLLDENPLVDIQNVMKIRAVVANGRYFDRATLDTMDTMKSNEGLIAAHRLLEQQAGASPRGNPTP